MNKEPILDANDKGWNRHLAKAKAWLRDSGLRDWVHGQNKNKGVAPAKEDVWKQSIASFASDDAGAFRPGKRPWWKRRQINEWVLRLAHRSHVLRGAFKDGERLPLETLRAKALGRRPLTLFGDRSPKRCSPKWGRKTAPKR